MGKTVGKTWDETVQGREGGATSFIRNALGLRRSAILRKSASGHVLGLVIAGGAWFLAQPALAANWNVSDRNQLNVAIVSAASGDTITFTSDITLGSSLPHIGKDLTFIGNGHTLSGGNQHAAFHIVNRNAGSGPISVAIDGLTIVDSRAKGGDGGSVTNGSQSGGGGGGAGLGGALFIGSGANVSLSSVNFERNSAIGGKGGNQGGGSPGTQGGGGGGGRYGNGGDGRLFGYGGAGGAGGGGHGGSTPGLGAYWAESGEFGGGGGGAGYDYFAPGSGGFGGGGGGASAMEVEQEWGGGTPGFGGGYGTSKRDGQGYQGGGGAGLGGAIFVQDGGNLILSGSLTIDGNRVAGGLGGAGQDAESHAMYNGKGLGSALFLQGNGSLTFAPGAGQTQIISDTIATEGGAGGAGNYVLIKDGKGTTILTGANAYSNLVEVRDGTLQGNTRSLVSAIHNKASLVFDQREAGTYGYVISGTGTLTKTGAGDLTLRGQGQNTYTGDTLIKQGALLLGTSFALSSATAITLDGGRLGVEDITATVDNAITIGASPGSGFHAGEGGHLIVNSVVKGGQLAKTGAGEVTLAGANTFAGARVTAGTLRFGAEANLGALSGVISIKDARIAPTADAMSGLTIRQGLALEGRGGVDVASKELTLSGVISGSGALVKTGAGQLSLTGANTYAGGTSVLGGDLAVRSDNALGAAGGKVTLAGGALRATESFATTRAIALNADGGALRVDEAKTLTLGGVVSGASLHKFGSGTLALSGTANTYAGSNHIHAGGLLGDSATIRGDVIFEGSGTGNRSVTFTQARAGAFGGAITGAGSVIKTGAGALTLTGANSYSGGTTVLDGALVGTSSSLQGDIANQGSLVFDQDDDGTYAGALTGAGRLTKAGVGRLTLTGLDVAGGGTSINAGTLAVNGMLVTPQLFVNQGGTLAGSQFVDGEVVVNGGTVAPGNSIGTLHITGNLTMAPASDYVVELNGNASDQIVVGKAATILSSKFEIVRLDTALSPVLPGSTYTILTTGGGLTVQSPTIAVADGDYPFVSFILSTDGYNGYLTTARSQEQFAEFATTRNEVAVARALDTAGSGPIWQQVVGGTASQASAAFASLSNAAIHASAIGILSQQSHFVRDAVMDRLRDVIPGQVQPSASVVASGVQPTGSAMTAAPLYAIWGQALGSRGARNGDGNAARITDTVGGLIAGADVSFGPTWRFGFAGGYSQTTFKSPESTASGYSDSYHATLYGGWQSNGWSLRGGAAFSWHDIDTARRVSVAGLGGGQNGSYGVGATQLFAEGAYRFEHGVAAFEPYVNLAYVSLSGDVKENGLAAMAGRADMDTAYATLGLRVSTTIADRLKLRGSLGWRRAFGDVTPMAMLAFSGGAPFGLAGAPIARDALVGDIGVDFAITPVATLGLSYSGQVGGGAYENTARANFVWRF